MKFWISLALLTGISSQVAHAQVASSQTDEEFNFKVSDGRLSDVVGEVAAQARATVKVDATGKSEQVPGVEGVYTLRSALAKVLAGTDWRVESSGGGALRIVSRSTGDAIVVVGRRTDFVKTVSSMLTRTDTPLRQTPATVDTVTREVFKSQNAISVAEALRNLPGVLYAVRGDSSQAIIGQDPSGGLTFTNGLRNSLNSQNGPLTDIEAIEVLKGPASILVGSSIAGGVINFVPKRATGREQYEVTFGGGTGDELLASADAGGAISKDAGVFWRVSGLSQYAETSPYGRGVSPEQKVINPILGLRNGGTKLDLTFEYFTKVTPSNPLSAYLGNGEFLDWGDKVDPGSMISVDSYRGSYDLEQNLTSSDSFELKFRTRGQYQHSTRAVQATRPVTPAYYQFGSYITQSSERSTDDAYSAYADLYAKFSTGSVVHQLIGAVDYYNDEYTYAYSGRGYFGRPAPLPALPASDAPRSKSTVAQYGIILQDQITAGRFHALLGLRETIYNSKSYSQTGLLQGVTKKKILLPNGGLVYDVTNEISTYVSYAKSFAPNGPSYVMEDGSVVPATLRTQYEGGVKAGFFDDRLTANASIYRYVTSNSPLADPSGGNFYISGPGVKAVGGELSVSGSVTKSIKLLSGVALSSGKQPSNGDTRMLGAPKVTGNLWALKTFQIGDRKSVDFGFGGNYASGFNVRNPYATGTPIYEIKRASVSVNSSLGVHIANLTINAMVNNILNRRNYQASTYAGAIGYDVPRSFRINLTGNF